MKTLFLSLLAILAILVSAIAAPSQEATMAGDLPHTERLPGVDLAQGITQITGVAISPLLGVSSVGAWKYFQAPKNLRDQLPWFCQPYIWGAGFCLIALCFLKDFFGTAAPPLIKKPLDIAELFESKFSALVACSAFLPFILSEIGRHSPIQTTLLSVPGSHFPFLAVVSFDVRILTIPLAIVAFVIVWLAGHAINVLIALCPFGFIDAVLKLFKAALLSSVVISSFINPYFGMAVSLIILLVAGYFAPWAFRLTLFGTVFGLDVLFPKRRARFARPTEPHAFLARRIADTPVRTYGRLTRAEDGSVTFSYRPWLVLPKRSVEMPSGDIAIAKGLLFPSLLHSFNQQRRRIIIIFLPRYRSHEQAIASHFQIVDVQDSTIIKGFKAMRAWVADTINLGKNKYAQVRQQVTERGIIPS